MLVAAVVDVDPRWTGCSALAVSAGASPEVSVPQASTSAAELTRTFTSAVNGYRMSFPGDWTVVAASKPSRPGRPSTDAMTDKFLSPQTRAVYVTSEALPAGWTDDQWVTTRFRRLARARCLSASRRETSWVPVTVGGHPGGMLGGDFGCSFSKVLVFLDHRVYVFNAMPDPFHVNTDIFDQGLFAAMLASVELTPETAP